MTYGVESFVAICSCALLALYEIFRAAADDDDRRMQASLCAPWVGRHLATAAFVTFADRSDYTLGVNS